jgi:cytochrome c5
MKKFFCTSVLALSTTLSAAVATAAATPGAEENYKGSCAVCHDAGVGGAPKLGDKAAWAPRIKQGKDALYKVSLQGKPGTAMIAKGGSAKLSDAEVRAIVDLMMAKAR